MTNIAKARELLPCPFCGGTDGDLVQGFTRATEDFAFWSVECTRCGAEIASDTSQDEADEHWNTRIALARPEAVEDGLVEHVALNVADMIEQHMKSSAMIWSLGKDLPDDWMTELRSITVAALESEISRILSRIGDNRFQPGITPKPSEMIV